MAAILEAEANLTTQNQITIPVNVRKVLGLQGGKSRVKFKISPKGEVLVSRMEARRSSQSQDTALKPFLKLLVKNLETAPERIKPFPASMLKRARSVIAGVKVDLNGPLTGED